MLRSFVPTELAALAALAALAGETVATALVALLALMSRFFNDAIERDRNWRPVTSFVDG